MTDLSELHNALRSAVDHGGSHKVFFYASGKNGSGIRHGFIHVLNANECQLSFEHLDCENALSEISRLKFIRVQSLPMLAEDSSASGNPIQDIADVLHTLDPALHAQPTESVAPPQGTESAQARGVAPAQADAASGANHRESGLTPTQLKAEAIALLQTYYGNSAGQKVAEIEAKHSPLTDPVQFLDACRQSAALLVGALKASEVFKGVYAKL